MNLIKWIINKKETERELDNLDRDLYLEKAKVYKLKLQLQSLEIVEERNLEHIETIKNLRKEIRKLKKELKESVK